nr:sigma-70 family RNA polymerase sigma factor [uncultured Oscillibacter sp.]
MTEQELSNAMETYGDAVYRLALCRMQNTADAEDVYQDVFLRLLEQRSGRWDGEHLKAWLLRTALNRCADLGRLRRRRGSLSLEEVPDAARPMDEEAAELWDAVSRLPEKLRTAVHLFYGEGYESGEIGALLGVPAATVRSRLRRARAELKNLLGGFDDGKSLPEADGTDPYARRAE